jgi:hypothetical protein
MRLPFSHHPLVTAAVSITVLLVMVDAFQRLPDQTIEDRGFDELSVPSSKAIKTLNPEDYQQLMAKLAQYAPKTEALDEAESVVTKNELTQQQKLRLTKESQRQQQGELKHLYIDDSRYQLVAIFNQQTPLAVFEKETLESGKKQLIEWPLHNAINHYQLNNVEAAQVRIVNGDKDITMRIFNLL